MARSAGWVNRLVGLAIVLLMATTVGCGRGNAPPASLDGAAPAADRTEHDSAHRGTVAAPVKLTADGPVDRSPVTDTLEPLPEVVFHTSLGAVKVRLRSDMTPVTVDNFLNHYVAREAYDGTIFHHVEKGFIVAGGGFDAQGEARPPRAPIRNEASQGLKNRRGTLAMAREADSPHSATGQFFFNLSDNATLDHQSDDSAANYGYCAFGEVVEGWDVVERMAEGAVEAQGEFTHRPVTPILIERVERVR